MAVSYAGRLKKNYNYGPCGLPEKLDPDRVRTYKLNTICQLIDDARYIVVHTGAGISTASRIPDFRGPNGVWTLESKKQNQERQIEKGNKQQDAYSAPEQENKKKRKRRNPWEEKGVTPPAELALTAQPTNTAVDDKENTPKEDGDNGGKQAQEEKSADIPWTEAKPSLTHMALQALVKTGKVKAIVTQNVDGLHSKSGIPDKKLMELHGNVFKETCSKCEKVYARDFDVGGVGLQKTGRTCDKPGCKGELIDCLLDWDSPLPEDQLTLAERHCKKADLAICLGTSLRVSPANTLPVLTKDAGGGLVIVNLQETLIDSLATVKLHDYTDRTMQHIMDHLKMKVPEFGQPTEEKKPWRPRPTGSRRSTRLSGESTVDWVLDLAETKMPETDWTGPEKFEAPASDSPPRQEDSANTTHASGATEEATATPFVIAEEDSARTTPATGPMDLMEVDKQSNASETSNTTTSSLETNLSEFGGTDEVVLIASKEGSTPPLSDEEMAESPSKRPKLGEVEPIEAAAQ